MTKQDADDFANACYGMMLREMIADGSLILAEPPSRSEVILHVWELCGDFWPESNVQGKMIVATDPDDSFVFDLIRYGDVFVIECEGVVVQRVGIVA